MHIDTEKEKALKEALTKALPAIRQVLPPSSSLEPEKIVRLAIMDALNSDGLKDCDGYSIARCVVQAAALGLHVGPLLAESYLVPFKNSCQLIPGYKGLIKLAVQGLSMRSCEARLVYAEDRFEPEYGTSPKIVHIPKLDSSKRADADIIAGYFVAQLRDGNTYFEIMTRAEVEKRRAASKKATSGPWKDWYPEQFKKTTVRYGVKLLPASSDTDAYERLQAAIELDNRYDTDDLLTPNSLLDTQASINEAVADKTRSKIEAMKSQRSTPHQRQLSSAQPNELDEIAQQDRDVAELDRVRANAQK